MMEAAIEARELRYTYEDGMYVLSLNCILQGKETAE